MSSVPCHLLEPAFMKKRLILGLLSVTALAATGLYAANTQHPATMLVLDASGSMWGQIGGKAKIAIAREAVDAMLDGWNGGDLGLMAYGHNRKGDCGDIEVLQAVGPATAAGIRARVAALNPKGMTPISAAVRQAAAQLRFTERKATVILVSDGEETCNADPCALGKELEAAGVDFTAHVVGFDIQKGSKAHKQLQCLAANTGGRYVDAKDAGELNRALQSVASADKPRQRDGDPDMTGRMYDTSFGRLTISQWTSDRMAGRYAGAASDGSDAGRIEGVVTQDARDGSASLKGFWTQKTAGQRCETPRDGTHYWGSATLIFNRKRTEFQGYWDYCDAGGAAEGAWHGTLIGPDPALKK